VHDDAGRRIETILRKVEPVLPGEKIANLYQAHGVVGRYTFDAGRCAERGDRNEPNQQQKNPAFAPGSARDARVWAADKDIGQARDWRCPEKLGFQL
jgi:hypothetical protein